MKKDVKTLEELRDYFGEDHFAAGQGIVIEQADEAGARCSLALRDGQKNAMGYAQGGLLYTLADFTFAVAANAAGPNTVTLNSSIHYVKGVRQGTVTAVAALKSRTRATCVYEVTVTDEAGELLALATMTGYTKASRAPE